MPPAALGFRVQQMSVGAVVNIAAERNMTTTAEGVETLHARAEEGGHMPKHRASYDWVLARSVARRLVVATALMPHVLPSSLPSTA